MNLISLFTILLSFSIILMFFVPVLRFHISIYKRKLIYTLIAESIFISFGIVFISAYFTPPLILWGLFSAFHFVAILASYMLKKVDYYLETIIKEILIITRLLFGIFFLVLVWELSVPLNINLIFVRIVWLFIPLGSLIFQRMFIRNVGNFYAILIYVLLSVIKWTIFSHWSVYSVILLYVYSFLAGYVITWMKKTTRAEMIVSQNISASKLWFVIVALAGTLVLAF